MKLEEQQIHTFNTITAAHALEVSEVIVQARLIMYYLNFGT